MAKNKDIKTMQETMDDELYGLNPNSYLRETLCKLYQTNDWLALSKQATKGQLTLKSFYIPLIISKDSKNKQFSLVYDENANRQGKASYTWSDDGLKWKNALTKFIPRWMSPNVAKRTGNIYIKFNWYKCVMQYLSNNIIETFPLFKSGIVYLPQYGAWKRLSSDDTIVTAFNHSLLDELVSWGFDDDQTMNDGMKKSKKILESKVRLNYVDRPDELTKPKLVAFKNGTYNFATGQVQSHSREDHLLNIHDYDVDFNSHQAPETDRLLTGMMGPAAKFFKEFIGYLFYPSHKEFQDFIFLNGEGGEGKSTLLSYIGKDLIGKDNMTAIEPQQLDNGDGRGDKFATYSFYLKEVNIVADISHKPITDATVLKQILGSDSMSVQKKYGNRFEIVSRAKNIWSANSLPPITGADANKAMKDRVNVIKLINGDTREANNNFWQIHNMQKVRQERPQFVGECLHLFQEVLKRYSEGQGKNSWSKPQVITDNNTQYFQDSDPIARWLESVKEENSCMFENGYFYPDDAYTDYTDWCTNEGVYRLSKGNLRKALTERFGFKYKRIHNPEGSEEQKKRGKMPYVWANQRLADEWEADGVKWDSYRNPIRNDEPK